MKIKRCPEIVTGFDNFKHLPVAWDTAIHDLEREFAGRSRNACCDEERDEWMTLLDQVTDFLWASCYFLSWSIAAEVGGKTAEEVSDFYFEEDWLEGRKMEQFSEGWMLLLIARESFMGAAVAEDLDAVRDLLETMGGSESVVEEIISTAIEQAPELCPDVEAFWSL